MEIASQIYRKIKWQVEKFSERCEVYGVVFIYGPYLSFSGLVFFILKSLNLCSWKMQYKTDMKCSFFKVFNVFFNKTNSYSKSVKL